MNALISGATGLIGGRIAQAVDVCRMFSRDPQRAQEQMPKCQAFAWHPTRELPPAEAFEDVDVVFHLAGEPIGRWDKAKKKRIYDSRVVGTRNLVEGLNSLSTRPKTLVCASAIGYYGDHGDEELTETSSAGDDFLAQVCVDWEREAAKATVLGMRVVSVRVGIVLSSTGGALAQMLTPFKLGVGGYLGDGSQWIPWVHLDDVIGVFLHAAQNDAVSGPVNAVSPAPVTNKEFSQTLAQRLHRPCWRIPKFAVRAALGEMSDAALGSYRVLPQVAASTGYSFQFDVLDDALGDVLAKEA